MRRRLDVLSFRAAGPFVGETFTLDLERLRDAAALIDATREERRRASRIVDMFKPRPSPFKRCACGRSYATLEAFRRLPHVSTTSSPACEPRVFHDGARDEGHAMEIESRNCPCGSTIAVDLLALPSWEDA